MCVHEPESAAVAAPTKLAVHMHACIAHTMHIRMNLVGLLLDTLIKNYKFLSDSFEILLGVVLPFTP